MSSQQRAIETLASIRDAFTSAISSTNDSGASYRSPDGIVHFVEEIIGAKPKPYQKRILRRFVIEKRLSVRALHGVGKTALAAWIIIWLMCVFPEETDVKVVTTASAWRQLEKFLWVEIKKWVYKADFEKINIVVRPGRELLGLSFKLKNKEAFAAASDRPELMEGAHATVLAYIFDEAKAIPPPTWDAAEGAFSQAGLDGHEAYAFAISTPGDEAGRFYDIQSGKPGYEDWGNDHVTLEEALECGQVSQEWVDRRKAQWGEDSVVYIRRVKGQFASSASTSVIPLSWVEASNERWLAWMDNEDEEEFLEWDKSEEAIGCDPARFGDDKTVIARMKKFILTSLERMAKYDTMAVANYVADIDVLKDKAVAVDVIGLGAGVVDRLREKGHPVFGVNVSEASNWTDISGELFFADLRSALWWMLREYLDPDMPRGFHINLPPDDDLTTELISPSWDETGRGVIKVESKTQIRKRLGRSTDSADATILAMYASIIGFSHGIYV